MANLTDAQLQFVLFDVFLKDEAPRASWFRLSNAGLGNHWWDATTVNSGAGGSGMSTGLVQFDFASNNPSVIGDRA